MHRIGTTHIMLSCILYICLFKVYAIMANILTGFGSNSIRSAFSI